MRLDTFFEKFEQLAVTPTAVTKLRALIVDLGVRGHLVANRAGDKPVALSLGLADASSTMKLPANWRSGVLGDAITLEYGANLPAGKRSGSGAFPVYGSNGIVGTHDSFLTIEPAIIVGRKGSAGALNIAGGPSWTTDVAYFVRPPADIDFRFAYYLLASLRLDELGKGIKPGLSRKEAYELPIALPPLAEQKLIVAKVDELMTLCDRLDAQQQERQTGHAALARASLARFADAPTPANLNFLFHDSYTIDPADLRQSILTLAMQGNLTPHDSDDQSANKLLKASLEAQGKNKKWAGPIPEQEEPFKLPPSWAWLRLGDVASLKHGYAFSSEFFTTKTAPFVLTTPGNFYEKGGFRDRESKRKYYSGPVDPDFILKPGDLIIPMTEQAAGLLGSPAFIPDDGRVYIHNQRLGKISLSESILPEFAFWFFNCELFRSELARTCTGMKVRHTSPDRVLRVPFPVCSLAEQRRIVAKVEQLLALVDELEAAIGKAQSTSALLLESLISELTRGRAAT